MSATSEGLKVRILTGGTMAVTLPDPHEEQRGAALRAMAEEQAAGWRDVWGGLPHRSERRPIGWEARERELQERSLGRPPGMGERQGTVGGKTEVFYLHPMTDDVYLFSLASGIPELAPRLAAMRAEMEARPEEFRGAFERARLFDLRLFLQCGQPWEDTAPADAFERAAEATLAAFVCYVATPRTELGTQAGGQILAGLGTWSDRARWVVGTWMRWPWWPDTGI